jgi:DNA replication protein DnaC
MDSRFMVQIDQLSKEQQQLLDLMKSGKSVYFTGNAGTGKTILLKHFIQYLKETRKRFAITVNFNSFRLPLV